MPILEVRTCLFTFLPRANFAIYCLLAKMINTPDKFSLHSDVAAHVWNFFQKWYSFTGVERPNTILQGEFQNYTEWWHDWYGEDDDE